MSSFVFFQLDYLTNQTMQKHLLLSIFLFTFSRFVIQNIKETSCTGNLVQGLIIKPGKCFVLDPNFNMTGKVNHNGNNYKQEVNCNADCSFCKESYTIPYGCTLINQTKLYNELYFGEPTPIKETGFYFDLHGNKESCQRNVETFYTSYFVQTSCVSRGFLGMKSNSQRLEYISQRNIVLLEEYDQSDCKGTPHRRSLFPINQCSEIPGAPQGFNVRPKRKI